MSAKFGINDRLGSGRFASRRKNPIVGFITIFLSSIAMRRRLGRRYVWRETALVAACFGCLLPPMLLLHQQAALYISFHRYFCSLVGDTVVQPFLPQAIVSYP